MTTFVIIGLRLLAHRDNNNNWCCKFVVLVYNTLMKTSLFSLWVYGMPSHHIIKMSCVALKMLIDRLYGQPILPLAQLTNSHGGEVARARGGGWCATGSIQFCALPCVQELCVPSVLSASLCASFAPIVLRAHATASTQDNSNSYETSQIDSRQGCWK